MIAEIGNLASVIALLCAILLAVYPLWGSYSQNQIMIASAKPLAFGVFIFTGIAYGCLTYSFLHDDFTIAYVANHSNSMLPWYYKVTAVWGGHEGSFLLWVLIFSVWMMAVAIFSKGIPEVMVARVLAILGLVSIGFYFFMLLTSNPFLSVLPFYPVDGADLNPLLQDFGMIIHPPMLYMGYVGFSVAFAFAIAALLSGQLDSTWARWSRPWTIAAWAFLTVGIALGSWWAYYELGWGGWWFWDPVENASFMPWLVGTALMHSLAVTEKRKVFKSWTVLLAISAFSLSLLGTFLVRSGILVSVHSFAADPSRGMFILGLLVLVIGGSLLLYFFRATQLQSRSQYALSSRENMLLGNNILLCAATVVVLLGTLFPLVHKELGLGSISIGAPFFNQMFTVLIVPFVVFMTIGPISRWKRQDVWALRNQILSGLGLGLGAAILIVYSYDTMSYVAILGMLLAVWILISTVQEVLQRVNAQKTISTVTALRNLTRSHWGMILGHVGFAVTLIGITLVSNFETERNVRMNFGERFEIAGYTIAFSEVKNVQGPNYTAERGIFDVYKNDAFVAHLEPEKRFYPVQSTNMTEAGIHSTLARDLFIALGEPLEEGVWSVRAYYKPFVVWIWLGAGIMALGGVFSIADPRYRLQKMAKLKQLAKRKTLATDTQEQQHV
ncbi:MAG: heme lyase CcmF/NrfE family subunit [Glaciecola sp.]